MSWVGAAASAAPDGLSLDLRLKGDEIEATTYTPELPTTVPAPVSLFGDAKGLDATLDKLRRSPVLSTQLGPAATLGGLLDDVIALFAGEAALYVRPLPAGPEYMLVLEVADEGRARARPSGL